MIKFSHLESSSDIPTEDWRIVVLEHDEGSKELGGYVHRLWPDITEVCKIRADLSTKEDIRQAIRSCIGDKKGRILTLYGSGKSHQLTYGLCTEVADKRSDEYGYVHFDAHNDFADSPSKTIDYGNFVREIMKDSNATALRHIGCVTCHISPLISESVKNFRSVSRLEDPNDFKSLLKNLPDDVYATTDIDVLKGHLAIAESAWGEGPLSLNMYLECLDILKTYKNLISADVLGYSKGDCTWKDSNTLDTYAKIARKIISYNS